MKRFLRGLLAIVVALTMISCATMGNVSGQKYSETYQIEDHSDDYTYGWNYVFPYENSDYYVIMFLGMDLRPIAIVAPVDFFVPEEEITEEYVGMWVWSIKHKTELNEGYDMGIVPNAEEGVAMVEYILETFLTI